MFTRVLIPLDGSPQAAVALPLARAFVGSGGTELVPLRVVETPTSLPVDSSDEVFGARAYVNWVASELRSGPSRVKAVVRVGSPGDEIVGAAEACQADLVVMATYRRGWNRAADLCLCGRPRRRKTAPCQSWWSGQAVDGSSACARCSWPWTALRAAGRRSRPRSISRADITRESH
jgi:nucleotide-binding universal stress UspA family protein